VVALVVAAILQEIVVTFHRVIKDNRLELFISKVHKI